MPACPSCGQENPEGFRFCGACGAPLEALIPREERKVVTVIFCDLVGFTARAERMDPEDVRALLGRYHARLRAELERFGGTVEKFIGDAVMALFGAPVAHEDDPERAVRAAIAIRDWITEEHGDLQVRIAVNTGEALVSLDARPHEGEAMATGDVVNTAQRMQAAAPVNGVLVGEQTYRATRDAIEYREIERLAAKGKATPIPAWEALGARSRLGVDLARGPRTPLVGRQRELDLLVSALARAREGRSPQLVTLVGVPGIGKSRLVVELFAVAEREPELITWRQGRCLPYGDGVSLWALGEMIKAQAGILESDTEEQAEVKLQRAVAKVVPDAHEAPWVEQELRPLVGVGGELGRSERSVEAFAAWRRFFEGLGDLGPLVLVFEDLHWADEVLLDFLDELTDRVRHAPLLIVGTARPELLDGRPGWGGGKANVLTISLPPLTDDETARVVAAALGQPVLEADAQQVLLARAAGNPLYAEQFARVLTEVGRLDEVPETVHGIIAARLDALSAHEKALLQHGAVVGKVFWLGAVEEIGRVSRAHAEELLYGLERKEFVQRARRASVAGEVEFSFRHVLLRDVAYGQMPRAARAEQHRRAAEWIESLGRPDDHAEMLAHHYSSALEYTEAVGREDPALAGRARVALRAAGDRAFALASYVSAVRFYGAALELWPEDDPERAELLVRTGRANFSVDRTGMELLEQGFEELRSGGDADGATKAAVELARVFWLRGDRDTAYSYVDQALELAEGRPGTPAKAHALVARAGYHLVAGEYPETISLAREALPLADALEIGGLRARARDVLGASRAMTGDIGGLADLEEAIAIARENNVFFGLVTAHNNLWAAQFFLGRLEAASKTLAIIASEVERYGTADNRRWVRTVEATELFIRGEWDEALRIADEFIAQTDARSPNYLEAAWRQLRTWIALARGDLASASADAESAVELGRRTKDPQAFMPALATRAAVLAASGLPGEASALASEVLDRGSFLVSDLVSELAGGVLIDFVWLLRDLGLEGKLLVALESAPSTPWVQAATAIALGDVDAAIELVASIGAPSVEAFAQLRAAEALVRAGRRAQADEQLAHALTFYKQVGATRYIRRAEELLAASA